MSELVGGTPAETEGLWERSSREGLGGAEPTLDLPDLFSSELGVRSWEDDFPADGYEALGLPGRRKVKAPEIRKELMLPRKWRVVIRGTWQRQEHNNVLEARAGLMAVRRAARSQGNHHKRMLLITDSTATQGVFSKGRSSSFPLLLLSRRLCSVSAALRMKTGWRYVNTKRNPSDAPSRGSRWAGMK
jgi:hypothetical protein